MKEKENKSTVGQHRQEWWKIAQPLGVCEIAYKYRFGQPTWFGYGYSHDLFSDPGLPENPKPEALLQWEIENPKPTSEEFILKLANRVAALETALAEKGGMR